MILHGHLDMAMEVNPEELDVLRHLLSYGATTDEGIRRMGWPNNRFEPTFLSIGRRRVMQRNTPKSFGIA